MTPIPKILAGEITQVEQTDIYCANKETFRKLKAIQIRLKSDRDKYKSMLEAIK